MKLYVSSGKLVPLLALSLTALGCGPPDSDSESFAPRDAYDAVRQVESEFTSIPEPATGPSGGEMDNSPIGSTAEQ